MIAEAEISAPVPSLSPDDIPAVTVFVAFDPTQPVGQQFTFTTPSGTVRHLVVTETTALTFTLSGETGATWANPPLTPISPPQDFSVPDHVGNSVTFTIDPPGHYFIPWIFNFNIDWKNGSTDNIQNVMSPSFYLINVDKDPGDNLTLAVEIDYCTDTGVFTFTPSTSSTSIGSTLASQLILVNTFSSTITFNLVTKMSTGAQPRLSATFPSSAIVWGAGMAPNWASAPPPLEGNLTQKLQITGGTGNTISQMAGFQFAINYGGVTILSPDPILINATIGDGN